MGALRNKMIEEMKLRNFASRTQKSYLAVMVGLAKHYRQFPDQLTQEQIRTYLLHLQERGLSSSSQNVAISGLRFFYQQVLGWNQAQLFLPPRKRTWRLPEVLSPREVERLLAAVVKLRDRCLLMTAYAAGLRVSELVHLKRSDIDPERMMIRVEQGKGKKDRYTILSQRLLGELRRYKQAYQPVSWVFFGKNRNCSLDISAAQKVYNLAKQKSGVEIGSPHTVLDYLGRYTHRVALSNDRILAVENGQVSFSYRDRKDGDREKALPLDAHEFIRRFPLHVLPDGFMRIRHFGFLANRSKKQALAQCRKLLGVNPALAQIPKESAKDLLLRVTGIDLSRCPSCQKGTMIVVAELPRLSSSSPWDSS